ncbi:MAG: hypothetical protein PV345_03475 [Wolbachia sp.]|nr:hypothetical protein [Wolbachia sp.]
MFPVLDAKSSPASENLPFDLLSVSAKALTTMQPKGPSNVKANTVDATLSIFHERVVPLFLLFSFE